MRVAAHYYDPAGTEFTFDNVFYDSLGNVFLDEQKQLPIPYHLAEEQATFDRYEVEDLPQGLRSVDAENLLYRMRALLRHPVRPAEKAPVHLANRAASPREQIFELQNQPLNVVQQGAESGARAYQRAVDERANHVARLIDAESRQQMVDSWKTISKHQQALNTAAAVAKRQWTEAKNAQFAAQNGGNVIGNDGRAKKN